MRNRMEINGTRTQTTTSMIDELVTTAATAGLKKSAPNPKLLIMWVAFLSGLITLAAYSLAHHPDLWKAIAEGQRF